MVSLEVYSALSTHIHSGGRPEYQGRPEFGCHTERTDWRIKLASQIVATYCGIALYNRLPVVDVGLPNVLVSPDMSSFSTQKFPSGRVFEVSRYFWGFDYLLFLRAFAYFNYIKMIINTFLPLSKEVRNYIIIVRVKK